MEPERHTYLLGKPFDMPTESDFKRAVAVSSTTANRLVAAYTILLQLIVLQVWTVVVLAGVLFSIRNREHDSNTAVVGVGIWNERGNPFRVLKLTAQYLWELRGRRHRWHLLLWVFGAILAVVVNIATPIIVTPYIVIGNSAPANPKEIYAPSLANSSIATLAKSNAIQYSAALRAAANVDTASAASLAKVFVGDLKVLADITGGEQIARVDYGYTVTGLDLGLQRYPDLVLNITGSCVTEYGWWNGSMEESGTGILGDSYNLWGGGEYQQTVSIADGRTPVAFFYLNPTTPVTENMTYAILISSVGRESATPGTDPLYLTEPDNSTGIFRVKRGRPALSCWQNEIRSYRGHHTSVTFAGAPGLNLSNSLAVLLVRFLSLPVIITHGTLLGPSALRSPTSTHIGNYFDAESCSFQSDLKRLVIGSYFTTINVLKDTTMFTRGDSGSFPDVIPFNGSAGFVLTGTKISTLSIPVLVAIPTTLIILWIGVYLLTNLPSPWYRIWALQSTVLYSSLSELIYSGDQWSRKSETAYCINSDLGHVNVIPEYHPPSLKWTNVEQTE